MGRTVITTTTLKTIERKNNIKQAQLESKKNFRTFEKPNIGWIAQVGRAQVYKTEDTWFNSTTRQLLFVTF